MISLLRTKCTHADATCYFDTQNEVQIPPMASGGKGVVKNFRSDTLSAFSTLLLSQ